MGYKRSWNTPRCVVCESRNTKRRPCSICDTSLCPPKDNPECKAKHDATWHPE